MCRKVIGVWLVSAFLLCDIANAQQFAYKVAFTDKNNTPYSLSTPLSYLSSRSLNRRAAQGISVDSTDLPVNRSYVDSVLALTGGILHVTSRWQNFCVILVSDTALIHALDGKTFISSKKLVATYSGTLHLRPTSTEPPAARTTTDATYYGLTWEQTNIVKGNYLHAGGLSGAGKLIAVIDAGFIGTDTHAGFDSLRNSGRIVDVRNFTFASNFVYNNDVHGTQVLSVMAGYLPNTFVGTAPLASYALYVTEHITEQPIELLNMVAATERADSIGADIITSSLGYNTFDNPADNFVFATDFDGKTTNVAIAANMATQKGILFVASAGNEGGTPWNMILTPGDADSALTIGNVNSSGGVAANSGYGPNAAGQVKPDVCAMGAPANVFSSTGFTANNGTSLSTPQVAGWAACLQQATPSATPYQLRQAIIRCASSYTAPGAHIGYGIPNFQCTQQMLDVADTPPPFTPAQWVIATPNPFYGDIIIAASPNADQDVEFSVIDMAGRKVTTFSRYLFKGYNKEITISLPALPTGIYVLKAVSATQQQVIKLVKP